METLYEITKAEFIEPKKQIDVPTYSNNIMTLKFDLKRKSGAKKVNLEFKSITRDLNRIHALKRKTKNNFGVSTTALVNLKEKPSPYVIRFVNSIEWIESLEERNMWLNALMQAENWGKK